MIFWIDKNIKIKYSDLLSDLNENRISYKNSGYEYFYSFLKSLTKRKKFINFHSLLKFLDDNANNLSFPQYTSGTTSLPKKVNVRLNNCIRQVKIVESGSKIWAMSYAFNSFASKQVFFQAIFNQETIINCSYRDFSFVNEIIYLNKATNLTCTPTFLNMLIINAKIQNHTLKTITVGGEKINRSIVNSYLDTFPNSKLVNIYASTEVGSLLYSNTDIFRIPKNI